MKLSSFLKKNKVYGNLVKYSHTTAMINKDMVAREFNAAYAKVKNKVQKIEEEVSKEYVEFRTTYSYHQRDRQLAFTHDFREVTLRGKNGDEIVISEGGLKLKLIGKEETDDATEFKFSLLANPETLEKIVERRTYLKGQLMIYKAEIQELDKEQEVFRKLRHGLS